MLVPLQVQDASLQLSANISDKAMEHGPDAELHPLLRETQMKIQAQGFNLAQPCQLQAFGELNQ